MVELRKAASTDIPFLVDLRRITMREHCQNAGVPYDEVKQRERVRYRFDCAQIVQVGGEDIGLLKVDRDSVPWKLLQIQLLPRFQGRGIGTALLNGLVSAARLGGVRIVLTVLKGNPARALYERSGFVVVKENAHSIDMAWSA